MPSLFRSALLAACAFGLGWSLRTPVNASPGDPQDRQTRALEELAARARRLDDVADRLRDLTRVLERGERQVTCRCER